MPSSQDSATNKQYVDAFVSLRKTYVVFSEILENLLKQAVRDLDIDAMVKVRVKDIPGFAEKIQRKGYTDPMRQMTDLCGGRIIVERADAIPRVNAWIREHFLIDEQNSEDKLQKLKDAEFGYRSVHFVVSLNKNADLSFCKKIKEVPDFLYDTYAEAGSGLAVPKYKAEIQVRTLLQHAWASVAHDNLYKSQFKTLKCKWKRDASRISALLENADDCFAAMLREIDAYKHHYGAYLSREEMQQEIDRLNFVREYDNDNHDLVRRIARLHMARGEHTRAGNVLATISREDPQARRDMAEALLQAKAPGDIAKARALLLELDEQIRRGELPPDPLIPDLLADAHPDEPETALEYSRRAYELKPSEPGILRRYIERKIIHERNCDFLPLLYPAITQALDFARQRTVLEVGLPWTWQDIAMLELLRNKPYAALEACIRAVTMSETLQGADGCIAVLQAMEKATQNKQAMQPGLPGLPWLRDFLLLAQAARCEDPEQRRTCLAPADSDCQGDLQGPVVIVAGGCAANIEQSLAAYGPLFEKAFRDFPGTLICGGTRSGISKIVGDLKASGVVDASCRLLSYLPEPLPDTVEKHGSYEIRLAPGEGFTPLAPLRAWMDILASGLCPADVRLVGVNGGQISRIEYLLAACLGAQVGLLPDSGREAWQLLDDPFWQARTNVLSLPTDAMTLRVFVQPAPAAKLIQSETREQLARQAHEAYCAGERPKVLDARKELEAWDTLDTTFKQSNLSQVDFFDTALRWAGLNARPACGPNTPKFKPTDTQVEIMAEMEHGRWVVDRLQDGWTWGKERDNTTKTRPQLVPWNALPEAEKEKDRQAVRNNIEKLQEAGYAIFEG